MSKAWDKVKEFTSRKKAATDLADDKLLPQDTFELAQKIEAQEMVIDSQVGRVSTNNVYWNDWIIINLWANYMANRFRYETPNAKDMVFINSVIRTAYIYGRCGVWVDNGTPYLCSIVKTELDKAWIYLIPDWAERQPEINKISLDKCNMVDRASVIEYRFDSLGFSAFIMLKPVIKFMQQTQKAIMNEMITLPTRIIHDTDAGASMAAAKRFIEMNGPILARVAGGSDTFKPLNLEGPNTTVLIETIDYFHNYYYEILGRRTNMEFKKAQLNKDEVKEQYTEFTVLEWDRYIFLKRFLQEFSTLMNIDITLEKSNGKMESVWS